MRILATASLSLAIALAGTALAQDGGLPDMGSSAAEMIDPGTEAEYAEYLLYELRRLDLLVEDPLIDDWLQGLGYRLAAASDVPDHGFTFFMMRDRQINAFATLGGHVGMNAGLVLTAETEDEVAGVLAHEIAHVTQRHVLRAYERASKDQLPILLAMLGAIAASQAVGDSGGRDDSSGNASMAAVAGAMALMQQRQIDYTRSNESEADRVGIQTLARAGYDPDGMADFFERMQRANRGNSGGYQLPEYLRTHPVTTTRISETRQLAARLDKERAAAVARVRAPASLLLPDELSLGGGERQADPGRSGRFRWARERLRVLSASSARQALQEYEALAAAPGARPDPARRYGLALAQLRAGQPREAAATLDGLLAGDPDNLWLALARAEASDRAHQDADATDRYEALLARHPDSRAVRLAYAEVLGRRATAASGRRAQDVLRPLLPVAGDDPLFQRNYARASELAGDEIRASEAYAEAAFLNGRAVDALNQLERLKQREDLTYYQRARIEARMAAITPVVLEMQRQGIRADEQRPDQR